MEIRLKQLNNEFDNMWHKYHFLIILLICMLLFDTLTTIEFMAHDGIEREFHPLVKYSALLFGPVTGTILCAFMFRTIAGLFLALYLHNFRLLILILPTITSTIAGFYNLFGK